MARVEVSALATILAAGVPSNKLLLALCAETDNPGAAFANRPALLQRICEDRSTDATAEVIPAFAPVDARPTQRPPALLKQLHINTSVGKEFSASNRNARRSVSRVQDL